MKNTPNFAKASLGMQKGFAPVLLILLVVVLIGGGAYLYTQNSFKEIVVPEVKEEGSLPVLTENAPQNEVKNDLEKTVVEDKNISPQNVDLWSVFDNVTVALKNKDISSHNKYSYTRVMPEETEQFIEFIPYLLDIHLKINEGDYVNKLQDDKQAIYSTIQQKDNKTDYFGYKQGVIMFIKKDGLWKLLSVGEPMWGITAITYINGPKRTQIEADVTLKEMMTDSDKDGLSDMDEKCEGAKIGDKNCIKTDPNKKDTNGNGWWDGIENRMESF